VHKKQKINQAGLVDSSPWSKLFYTDVIVRFERVALTKAVFSSFSKDKHAREEESRGAINEGSSAIKLFSKDNLVVPCGAFDTGKKLAV